MFSTKKLFIRLRCLNSQKKLFWTFWNPKIEFSNKEFLLKLEERLQQRQSELEVRLQQRQSELEARLQQRQSDQEARLQQRQSDQEARLQQQQSDQEARLHKTQLEFKTDIKSSLDDNNKKLVFMLVPILIAAVAIFETLGFSIDHPWKKLIFKKDKLTGETPSTNN
jgi:hypothetical protein